MYIENELKRFSREKVEVEEHYKDDPYKDLSPIPESEKELAKQRHNGFIEKLKEAIDKQEREEKQPKLKHPLEHYV